MMIGTVPPDARRLAQLVEDTLAQEPRDPRRIRQTIQECRELGVEMLPFDINRSALACAVEDERAIRIGFSALAPVPTEWVMAILTERSSGSLFTSFQDFCERLAGDRIPDDLLCRIIQIGGFDSLEPSRARLLHGRAIVIQHVRSAQAEQVTGQFNLFAPVSAGAATPIALPEVEEWTQAERIAQEEAALGFSFEEWMLDLETDDIDLRAGDDGEEADSDQPPTAPPVDEPPLPSDNEFSAADDAASLPDDDLRTCALAEESQAGEVEIRAEMPACESAGDTMQEAAVVELEETGAERENPELVIRLSTLATTDRALSRLREVLRQYPGPVPVCFQCIDLENQATIIPAGANWAIDPSDVCLDSIAAITGHHAVQLRQRSRCEICG
jgi:hypothetical protein